MVDDALHHEVHEVAHLLRLVIEPWRRRKDDRAGLRSEREVAQMHQRERRLARDQDQGATLLERHVGRALDQAAARAVRDRRHGPHRAGADHHSCRLHRPRGGLGATIRVVEHPQARPVAARRLLQRAIVRDAALFAEECGITDDRALKKATGGDWASLRMFDDTDRGAEPASGSVKTAGMVICPCSMGTVAAIAHGTSRSLIERAADVALKERRTLILVPRETPLSLVHLRNLTLATEAGAVVLPAAPGFYHKPQQVRNLVDFVVQRIVDHLGLDIALVKRWEEK